MKTLTQPEAFEQLRKHAEEEEAQQTAIRSFDTHAPIAAVVSDPRSAQLLALFSLLDERGKTTTLAMLAVAVKLHPKGV